MAEKEYSYNLTKEPWIKIHNLKGEQEKINLFDLFSKAHEILDIYDQSPLFEFGIYRFLIALVMDIYKPEDTINIQEKLEEGKFPDDFELFFKKNQTRFDLFDKKNPFYQGIIIEELKEKKLKPIVNIIQQFPKGINVIFFNHIFEDQHQISPEICAKALLALPVFTTMGGKGLSPGINGAPPIYVLIKGKNLFETILLNCVPNKMIDEKIKNHEAPWQTNFILKYHAEISVYSKLQGLTLLPRYVHLIPSNGGKCSYTNEESPILVRKNIFEPGFKITNIWDDPNVAYRFSKKGRSPIRFNINRPIWRDYGPLLMYKQKIFKSSDKKIEFRRPEVISQYLQYKSSSSKPSDSHVDVSIYGMRTDLKAKIFEWQKETLSGNTRILNSDKASIILKNGMEAADTVAYYLKRGISFLAQGKQGKNKKALQTLQNLAGWEYWTKLKTPFEKEFLQKLSENLEQSDLDLIIKKMWSTILRHHSINIFQKYSDNFSGTGRNLQYAAQAYNDLKFKINIFLKKYVGEIKD